MADTNPRDLIHGLAQSVEILLDMRSADAKPMRITEKRLDEARAYLASESDGSAVLNDREPTSVTTYPTDNELLELMPETMRDEFSYAARVCSDATGRQVKPGIFCVALNTAALEYARVVLARWGK